MSGPRPFIFVIAIAVFVCKASASEPVPWSRDRVSTTVKEQPLADFVKDFAASQDISVSVSEEVKGMVNGAFTDRQPADIFNSVMKAYGLVPYYDGSILYIYAASEMKSSVITLDKLGTAEFKILLGKLHVFDKNFTFRELADQGVVYISGPPRYVDLLDELAVKFDERVVEKAAVETQQRATDGSKIEVRYFPLRYAYADDVILDYNDRIVTIPGVARLLSYVLGNNSPELRETETTTSTRKPKTVKRLKGKGLVEGETPVRINQETKGERATKMKARDALEEPEEQREREEPMVQAFVQADSRLNAIIVADRADKMPLYEKLVKDLDQPAGVIEINAAIIDMNADANLNWGVDYRSQNTEVLETRPDGVTPATTGLFRTGQNATAALVDGAALVNGGGLNTSALLIGSTWQILARIKALEDAGEAQVLSRPSIITIDNTEAILRDDQTIHIRVAGQEEVDLFPVSAGVMLRVTPHLIKATKPGELNKIRLLIKIEDGGFATESIDAIPIVRRSEITTQAVVAENESLLIGGQYRHEQSNAETRVPIVGRIPLLGNAFKNKRIVNTKRQRLFLISPNVINPDEYYRKAERITHDALHGPPITDLEIPTKVIPLDRNVAPENSQPSVQATMVDPTGPPSSEKKKRNWLQRILKPKRND